MPRGKVLGDTKRISLNTEIEDIEYLKSRGIDKSKFFRQAVKALKEERLMYEY